MNKLKLSFDNAKGVYMYTIPGQHPEWWPSRGVSERDIAAQLRRLGWLVEGHEMIVSTTTKSNVSSQYGDTELVAQLEDGQVQVIDTCFFAERDLLLPWEYETVHNYNERKRNHLTNWVRSWVPDDNF